MMTMNFVVVLKSNGDKLEATVPPRLVSQIATEIKNNISRVRNKGD